MSSNLLSRVPRRLVNSATLSRPQSIRLCDSFLPLIWTVLLLHAQDSYIAVVDGALCLRDYPGFCTLAEMSPHQENWQTSFVEAIGAQYRNVVVKRVYLPVHFQMERFLETMAVYFNDCKFQHYHESIFPITHIVTFITIAVDHATKLQHLQLAPNEYLERLYIVDSAIESVPRTVANLKKLQFLGIDKALLRVLDLNLFCTLPYLRSVQFVDNRISLVLSTDPQNCASSLKDLDLKNNRLTNLNLAAFVPFVYLSRLILEGNGILSVFSTSRITLLHLSLLSLMGNKLSFFDTDQLFLPECGAIDLTNNLLKKVPTLSDKSVPNLEVLTLKGNQLSTVDLANFQKLQQLAHLDLSENLLTSVYASMPVHLPTLNQLGLGGNRLSSLSTQNWNFTNLANIILDRNLFDQVPTQILRNGVIQQLDMRSNPIRCILCCCLFWVIIYLDVPTTGQQCVSTFSGVCTISEISTAKNGWASSIRAASYPTIVVNKLLIPASPKALPAFIQIVSNITSTLEFVFYREKALLLVRQTPLGYLRINNAPFLEQLILEPNDYLFELTVYNGLIKYLPMTIRYIRNLEALSIQRMQLTQFNLNMFSDSQILTEVTVSNNMISELIVSSLTSALEFVFYQEKALLLARQTPLAYLRINNAPFLEQLILEPNDYLLELAVYNSSIKYLSLTVRYTQLTQFNLNMFSESQMLTEVTVSNNMISELVVTNQTVHIEFLAAVLCFCLFWVIIYLDVPTIGQECVPAVRGVCTFPQISTTKSGWASSIRTATYPTIVVNKLLIPASPKALPAFIQIVGNLAKNLEFMFYQEKILVLTRQTSLAYLSVNNCPFLEQLILEPNDYLLELSVYNGSIKYLPMTVRDIRNLKVLNVRYTQLTNLNLNVFSESQMLTEVTVNNNMIRNIVGTNRTVYIEFLAISNNRLTTVNMAFFKQIRNLTRLDLKNNQIVQIWSSEAVVLPMLSYFALDQNNLTSIQLNLVEIPKLAYLFLGHNKLTIFPRSLNKFPKLRTIDLHRNSLAFFDLTVLGTVPNLAMLDLQENQIASITTKTTIQHEAIEQLDFGNNGLKAVNFTGCSFPKLKYIDLGYNKVTTVVPNIFQQFPKAALYLTGINMSCSDLKGYTSEIYNLRLNVDTAWGSNVCSTRAHIQITNSKRACCLETQ
ncbi:AGAP007445-PA-like protein [Anopheles sinensis]|uniref:AGAP007445-PA-like protein n=1 Tax=Anopheles sinensis TaxID=74873 RepID=A0A084WN77_ANOSI|nr:AGAP007445-PA-like protein [Anopheles sinensis]